MYMHTQNIYIPNIHNEKSEQAHKPQPPKKLDNASYSEYNVCHTLYSEYETI